MKTRLIALLLGCAVALPPLTVWAANDIPVDRVILSTSGLANFGLKARVDGDAALQFPIRLEQVDDILKSLIVFDKGGRLGGVTLPGRQPLAEAFRDLPFSKEQLANPMLLLNAYQGATVSVKSEKISATGKILQVAPEQTQTKDGQIIVRHRLSLMTAEGMRQAVLEDLQSLQFADERPRTEIARALDTIRENGTSGQRMLTVNLMGSGARDVELSYVVDAPLWKTAYRMALPPSGKDTGLLQGWAVVENATASDWKNVDLTLVSGNPVTYRQALYQSYYVDRPEIPVQVFGRVMPRVDQGAVSTAAVAERDESAKDMPMERKGGLMKMQGFAGGSVGNAMAMESMSAADSAIAPTMAPAPMMGAPSYGMEAVAQAANAAQSTEATTQVLFRFPDRFSLKSGQSMMLPFVSRSVPMERISLYQPETHPTHPLAAVKIANDGETGLPPGILTLYEESDSLKGVEFVGDAQVPVIAAGETRMISYALDSKTTINREDKSASTEDRVTISQGVLNASVVNRLETVYTIKAPPKEDRVVVIEQPKMGADYKIVEPDPKQVEITDTHYRMRIPVKAGEAKAFSVVLENRAWQSYGIADLPTDRLLAYATAQGKLDDDTRKIFAKLAEMRRAIDSIDQQIANLDQKRQMIFNDQERVRENLKSLIGKSDVKEKYLSKLDEQEDMIGEIDKQKDKLSATRMEKLGEMQKSIAEIKL